jgi:hypothetical protein
MIPEDDPPPLLGSWRNLYALVLGNLVLMVLLFAWLTWSYS